MGKVPLVFFQYSCVLEALFTNSTKILHEKCFTVQLKTTSEKQTNKNQERKKTEEVLWFFVF